MQQQHSVLSTFQAHPLSFRAPDELHFAKNAQKSDSSSGSCECGRLT